jgi:hypothetical protein
MKASVIKVNPSRGMAAVTTENGDASVFEVLSSVEFHIGDDVSWQDHHPHGTSKVFNSSQRMSCDVYFEGHGIHPSMIYGYL